MRGSSKNRWLYEGLTVVFLALPLAGYFFAYVPSRQKYLANRNFRVLTVVGDDLRAKVENAARTLQNAAASAAESGDPSSFLSTEQRIKESLSLFPTLSLVRNPKLRLADSTQSISNSNKVVLTLAQDAAGCRFNFSYNGPAGTNTNVVVTIEAKADCDAFVAHRSEFDGLLVAQKEGEVFFQRSAAGWRVLHIGKLTGTKGEKFNEILARQASSLAEIELEQTDYRVFLQPLTISHVTAGEGVNQWWLCGLVQSGNFTAESWVISHRFVVNFFFLVLGSIVSLPFLKVLLSGCRETLSKGTVLFLGLSSLFAAALGTQVLLHFLIYEHSEEIFDRQLKAFSRNIKARITSELSSMHAQLLEFQEHGRTNQGEEFYGSNTNWLVLTSMLAKPNLVQRTNDCAYLFQQVLWIDGKGAPRKKWTVRNISTPFIDLKARAYFQDALLQRHSLYEFSSTNQPLSVNRFWLEPVLSWTTGERSAVLSTKGSNEVVALESSLLSLINPVAPEGFGYCIIANDGQVLFHSDSSRNLRENVLIESRGNARLRSALVGGFSEPFHFKYNGKTHRAYVTPLPDSRWSIVVFLNEHVVDSAIFDIFLLSFSLFCMYVLVLVLSWCALLRRFSWLWATREKVMRYLLFTAINAVFGIVFIFLIGRFSDPLSVTLIASLTGLTGIVVACLLLDFGKHSFGVRTICNCAGLKFPEFKRHLETCSRLLTDRWRGVYLWSLGSLVLIVAVLPAYGFFKAAYDTQMENFVTYGQVALAKQLQQRAERVENQYNTINLGDTRTNFLDGRLRLNGIPGGGLPLDVYSDFFFGTVCSNQSHCAEPADGNGTFKTWLTGLRPFHYRISSETYRLFRSAAFDASYHWHRFPDRLTLHKDRYRGNNTLEVSSEVPALNFFDLSIWRLLIGVIMLFGVIAYISYIIARHVFLLYSDQLVKEAKPSLRNRPTSNTLILEASLPRSAAKQDLPADYKMDLRKHREVNLWKDFSVGGTFPVPLSAAGEPSTRSTGLPASDVPLASVSPATPAPDLEPSAPSLETIASTTVKLFGTSRSVEPTKPASEEAAESSQQVVHLDHLDYQCDNPEFNDAKLDLLEKLNQDPRIILAVSSIVDPSNFRVSATAQEQQPQKKQADATTQKDQMGELHASHKRWTNLFQSFLRIHMPANALDQCRSVADYNAIWATCSIEERLALYQIARAGFISSSFPELPQLMARGLVIKAPKLKLNNEAFKDFVLRTFRSDELAEHESITTDSRWKNWKGPAKTALLILGLVLFCTQQELFDSIVKTAIAFTGSIPKLLDAVNFFRKDTPAK